MKFYTNCVTLGNYVCYRGFDNGKRVKEKIQYKPTLFVQSKKQTDFKTLDGKDVTPMKMGNIRDARNFFDRYKDISNFNIYGSTNYHLCCLSDMFPNDVQFDKDKIVIANLDIETESENGFPEPSVADQKITAITIHTKNRFYTFGCGNYQKSRDDVYYIKCSDEMDLLAKFLKFWKALEPDIITGWNCSNFDIPYLYNRYRRCCGENVAKQLSPWEAIRERTIIVFDKPRIQYTLVGISTIDYLDLFKKYSRSGKQESYKLDHIAHTVLGEGKVDYSEYGSLRNLYREDYQKFIDYNIKDVELVKKLDDKEKLIDIVLLLAYNAKANFDDVFGQTRLWDALLLNYCRSKKLILPPKKETAKAEKFKGAYVQNPEMGYHKWPVCFDVASLYPNLIRTLNVSVETLKPGHRNFSIDEALLLINKPENENICAANGHMFDGEIIGFLPKMVADLYQKRKDYKGKQLEAERKLELLKKEMMNRNLL